MIGSALKKLAKENGMKVAHGVAYGNYRGFAATFSEGAGYKQISFSTQIPDAAKKTVLMDQLGSMGLDKQYRVQNLGTDQKSFRIIFHDTMGTMTKLRAFLDMFIPLLQENGATAWNICPECGGTVTSGRWVLINGTAHYLHDTCAQKVTQGIREDEQALKDQQDGSYLTGGLGALLGATLGAVVWAVVLLGGYVASLVGLLIGWLSEKGYTLLKGRQGKGKLAILILAVIFGVCAGTIGADVFTLASYINDGDMYGLTYADIPAYLIFLFTEDPEYRSITLSNIGMGLLFAALGVFGLLRKTNNDVSDTKIVELDRT